MLRNMKFFVYFQTFFPVILDFKLCFLLLYYLPITEFSLLLAIANIFCLFVDHPTKLLKH